MVNNTDLLIVGAGAAGLWAACAAGRAGLRCLLLERRHRPGLKLLMCGNNRCNISQAGSAAELQAAYGEPVGSFLGPALRQLSPAALQQTLAAQGLPSKVLKNRIYPSSEKADDVLHCFTDQLRDLEVPLLLNCPAQKITHVSSEGFELQCGKLHFQTRFLLLATGGVSYPKTGSVGDGQRLAGELKHHLEPYRPGLAGIEVSDAWLRPPGGRVEVAIPSVRLKLSSQGREIATTAGNLLADRICLRGSAALDASRIIARQQLAAFDLTLDIFPEQTPAALAQALSRAWQKTKQPAATLNALGLEHALALPLAEKLARYFTGVPSWPELAQALKNLSLSATGIRPLKEAIVTVGGVSLADIDPATMQSRLQPGLFFAGEVMDIDGPTGGYNLQAAFATAELAISAICRQLSPSADSKAPRERRTQPSARADKKRAWGKDFWKNRPR